jgi:secreted trypsin-like serine protease
LMGLVSFGSQFCGIGRPGVYTRVDSFGPWIEKQIGRNYDD